MKPNKFALCALIALLTAPLSAPLLAQHGGTVPSFEAIAASQSEIRLYWLPAKAAQGYTLYRDNVVIAQVLASQREYLDTGLASNSQHVYKIVAHTGRISTYTERTFPVIPISEDNSLPQLEYDVVVVQASSSGVSAAYEASRRGLRVALVEPTLRLGGMPVNGLCSSDIRRDEHTSGFFGKLRERVREIYKAEGRAADGARYEPHISHQAMKSILYENPTLTVFRKWRLYSVHTKQSERDASRKVVVAATFEESDGNGASTGRRILMKAKVFIDATDCGDLAAFAGAPYRLGREARTHAEPHAGVIYYERSTRMALPGSTGEADKRIQAYSYLLVVKDFGKTADKTLPKPPNYHKEEFDYPGLPDWRSTWAATSGAMPNGKYELNQHPRGGDIQEINYRYPEGGYAERKRVDDLYRDRVLRYLYYIQTTYSMKNLGLPDDEFRESGGIPPLLYVREGRRILGEQLPTEEDIANGESLIRPESIGIGDYPMDSHAVRVKTDNDPRHMGEGEWWLFHRTPVYQIPFGIIVPKSLDNVFVTTAVSSTHVSFGTFRMEPVRMALGEAGGVAAVIVVKEGKANREVSVREVQEALLPRMSNPLGDPYIMLHFYPDLDSKSPNYYALQFMAVRGFLPTGAEFKANAPTTRGEMARWMELLASRAMRRAPNAANAAYLGAHITTEERIKAQFRAALSSGTTTRGEMARWLANLLPDTAPKLVAGHSHAYTDIPDEETRRAVSKLVSFGVHPELWAEANALMKDRDTRFSPNMPISHADAIFTLYLLQFAFGPLADDHPIDVRNGRRLPNSPSAIVPGAEMTPNDHFNQDYR